MSTGGREPRVVVVGAGAAGLATALAAARLGARVTVLEREHPATGSSGRSAGIFNRQTPDPLEQALRAYTVARLPELEAAGLVPVRCGYVRVARTDADRARLAAAAEHGRSLGIDDAVLLDRAGLARLVPGMACDDLAGGLFCPSDGHLDGHELCSAYAALGEAAGVELRHRTALVGATIDAGGVALATTDGTLRCDVVVNAAGPWAAGVAELLGTCVPLACQRHEICVAHLPAPLAPPLPVVNTYVPGAGARALYLRPEGPDRVLCGLHTHDAIAAPADPDAYAQSVAHETLEELAAELLARMPGWTDARLEPGWAGLYPVSPDGRFQVGPHAGAPRVVSAAGLGGVGLTTSAAVGQLAAEWAVLGEARAFPFAAELLPDRPTLAARSAR